jgi:hypothetical protein
MLGTELSLRLPNSPGALAGVVRLLAEERVRVVALMLDARGQLRLVTDNPVRAAGALRAAHHAVTEGPVIVAHTTGEPEAIAAVFRFVSDAGGNLDYAYVGRGEPGALVAVVLGIEDPQRLAAFAGL